MAKEMLINVSEGEECRIALVEDGRLEELYMERTSSTSHVGNVYKGRVINVEPSIQAAFVDFGLGRNGFLHISDLLPSYFGRKGDDVQEFVGKKMARRDRPPIQRCLRRGDDIIVQVIKEGIGTKGPTLSAYLSISGKMLVMMPGVNGRGVSRKIEDDDERRRLKQILDSLDPPEDCGFIIRTESVGKSKLEIERDLKYLARLWEQIKKKRDGSNGTAELYTEGDLVTRTVRDVFSGDVDHIVIDNREVADRVSDVIKLSNPRARNKVELYDEPIPLFHKYGIEREIEQMYSRHVPLRSGGSLVIDSTEAIVAIDVNSGKNRENSDAEMTAFNTDMEAADEICRQLKLRDLGGVIIVDFIDLRFERHRRELEGRLEENLKRDRAKTKVLQMSQFGIIEMTRQRMRPSLKRSVYFDCPHCKGAGLVKTPESMSLDVMRRLAMGIFDMKVVRVELAVNVDVAFYLQNKKRHHIADLEGYTRKRIVIRSDPALGLDEMRLELFDARDGTVVLDELSSLTQVPHKTQLNTRQPPAAPVAHRGDARPAIAGGRGGRPDNGRPGQRPSHPQPRNRPDEREDEREEFDRDMETIEDRTDNYEREDDESDVSSPDISAAGPQRRPQLNADSRSRDQRPRDSRPAVPENSDHSEEEPEGETREGEFHDDGRSELPQQEGDGGQRRRRRRRGRGRGRGGQPTGQEGQLPTPADAPVQVQGRHPRDQQPPRTRSDDDRGVRHEDKRDNRPVIARRDEGHVQPEDRKSREAREYREDQVFDAELRDAEARAVEDGGSTVDKEVIKADGHGERAHVNSTSAHHERAPHEAEEERETPEEDHGVEAEAAEAAEEEVIEAAVAKKPRRRGGRGRGKKKVDASAGEAATDSSVEEPGEISPDELDAEAPAEKAKPKRRRGTRGGKGRKKAIAPDVEGSKAAIAPAALAPTRTKRAAGTSAAKPQLKPVAVLEQPIVRTGSTDSHLEDEEPVLHEPVRRPRSYRDLDNIPDDYD